MDGINQSYHCMHLSALHVMYHSSSLIHGSLEPSVVVSLLNYRVTQQIDGRHIAPQTDREGERDPHTAPHHTAPHRTASHRTTPPRQQPSTRLHSLHTDTNAPAQNGERALCVCVSVCALHSVITQPVCLSACLSCLSAPLSMVHSVVCLFFSLHTNRVDDERKNERGVWIASIVYIHTYTCGVVWCVRVCPAGNERTHHRVNGMHGMGFSFGSVSHIMDIGQSTGGRECCTAR